MGHHGGVVVVAGVDAVDRRHPDTGAAVHWEIAASPP